MLNNKARTSNGVRNKIEHKNNSQYRNNYSNSNNTKRNMSNDNAVSLYGLLTLRSQMSPNANTEFRSSVVRKSNHRKCKINKSIKTTSNHVAQDNIVSTDNNQESNEINIEFIPAQRFIRNVKPTTHGPRQMMNSFRCKSSTRLNNDSCVSTTSNNNNNNSNILPRHCSPPFVGRGETPSVSRRSCSPQQVMLSEEFNEYLNKIIRREASSGSNVIESDNNDGNDHKEEAKQQNQCCDCCNNFKKLTDK